VLTLVLPNFTSTVAGPVYSNSQLAFVAVNVADSYATFVLVQTVRHRDYFLPATAGALRPMRMPSHLRLAPLGRRSVCCSSRWSRSSCSPRDWRRRWRGSGRRWPAVWRWSAWRSRRWSSHPRAWRPIAAQSVIGCQTSLNLALGSALATIGLTIPSVAVVSLMLDLPLSLGIDAKGITLLALSLMVSILSLAPGAPLFFQGAVHLVIFAAYLFTTIVP